VLAKTSARHTSAEFDDFLAKVVDSQPAGREIQVIADNSRAQQEKVTSFVPMPSIQKNRRPRAQNSLIPMRGLTKGRRQALDIDESQRRFKSRPQPSPQ
jgi:hypothetical protein